MKTKLVFCGRIPRATIAVVLMLLLLMPLVGGLQAQEPEIPSFPSPPVQDQGWELPVEIIPELPPPLCPNTATGPYVRLLAWEFDPLCQPEAFYLPATLVLDEYPEGKDGYYLVQFGGPIKQEWKEAVTIAGADLLDYIPDFTFVARMDTATRTKIAAMPMVRWVGIYQPGYRLAPELLDQVLSGGIYAARSLDLRIVTFPGEDIAAIQQQIQATGLQSGGMLRVAQNELGVTFEVQVDASGVEHLAGINGLRWIELAPEWVLHNEKAADVMDVRDVRDAHGLYGQGQIVGVCDTGLDQGSTSPGSLHNDFEDGSGSSRVIQIYDRVGDGANDVNSGHGTHVAGSVLGNGSRSGSTPSTHTYPNTSFAGMAPEAELVFQSVENNSSGSLSGIPGDLNTLFQQAYDAGARIHTNSWGSSQAGQYTTDSSNTDLFTWNNPDFTILFSAGNDGIDRNPGDGVVDLSNVGSPGTAKNCITVGASENNRPSPFSSGSWGSYWPYDFPNNPINPDPTADNPVGMAAFSSRGPLSDARYKPDLVAPGSYILSTRSSACGSCSGWRSYDTYYMYMGGTSMSTPLTAGAAALTREFYTDQGLTPSGALIKATMVNGATDLYPGQYGTGATQEQPTVRPNSVQGWGRVDLEQSIFPNSPRMMDFFDCSEGLQTNEYDTFTYDLTNTSESFRATLAWSDYPGTAAAGGGLVNDLDLHVIDAGSTTHYPTNATKRGGTQVGMNDTSPWNAYPSNSTYRYAARFTPSSYPVTVKQALVFVYSSSYPASFNLWVYANDGTGGAPGTVLYGPQTFTGTGPGWLAVDITGVPINSNGFYVAWQPTISSRPYVVTDQTAGGGDNRYWNGSSWVSWTNPDLSIRAVMAETDASTSYDRVNNLVGVDIGSPSSTGNYTVQVGGYSVAHGPQPYALVTSGATAFTGASSYRTFGSGNVAARTLGRTGVTLDFASGPGGNVTATMAKAAPSHSPPSGATFADIDWNISSAMTGFNTQVIFTYDEADLGSLTEGSIGGMFRWNSGTSSWDYQGGTLDTGANTVTVNNVTGFSDWAIGAFPTAVDLASFTTEPVPSGTAIALEWETATELDNLGFNLYRAEALDGPRTQLNASLIPGQNPGSPVGAVYTWQDESVTSGVTYYYWLEDVDIRGTATLHGPVTAELMSFFRRLPTRPRPAPAPLSLSDR